MSNLATLSYKLEFFYDIRLENWLILADWLQTKQDIRGEWITLHYILQDEQSDEVDIRILPKLQEIYQTFKENFLQKYAPLFSQIFYYHQAAQAGYDLLIKGSESLSHVLSIPVVREFIEAYAELVLCIWYQEENFEDDIDYLYDIYHMLQHMMTHFETSTSNDWHNIAFSKRSISILLKEAEGIYRKFIRKIPYHKLRLSVETYFSVYRQDPDRVVLPDFSVYATGEQAQTAYMQNFIKARKILESFYHILQQGFEERWIEFSISYDVVDIQYHFGFLNTLLGYYTSLKETNIILQNLEAFYYHFPIKITGNNQEDLATILEALVISKYIKMLICKNYLSLFTIAKTEKTQKDLTLLCPALETLELNNIQKAFIQHNTLKELIINLQADHSILLLDNLSNIHYINLNQLNSLKIKLSCQSLQQVFWQKQISLFIQKWQLILSYLPNCQYIELDLRAFFNIKQEAASIEMIKNNLTAFFQIMDYLKPLFQKITCIKLPIKIVVAKKYYNLSENEQKLYENAYKNLIFAKEETNT